MSKDENPWRDLAAPSEASGFSARRIAGVGSTEWGLYWAVDSWRQCLLVLAHGTGIRSSHRWPTLRGLRIERLPEGSGRRDFLVIRLTETEHRDIFYRFCTDIVDAAATSDSDQGALDTCILRTWRWHRLLKGGRDGRLTDEEQKGLIGELVLLREHVVPVIGVSDGIRSWVGPLGALRDFEVETVGLECKACAPLAPTVRVASADQLGSTRTKPLFLHVIEVAPALDDASEAVSVTDVVDQVRQQVETKDVAALGEFEERLWAVGYDPADDYSERRWVIGSSSFFAVVDGFPRITTPMLPMGVMDLRYKILLAACERFRVEATAVMQRISGDINDD